MRVFYDMVIYFVLFSFCGWVCESVFCSILERKPVNRGFLNGPFCPVYGFGGLIVVYLLTPLQYNTGLLFLSGMIAATVLEYFTSAILEKLFDTRWWDYSPNRFNINGRVCLSFSLIFGALSVVAVRLLYPPFNTLVEMIPDRIEPWIAWGMLALFAGDCASTVAAVLRLNGKLAEMEAAMREIRQKLEEASERGKQSALQLFEQYRENSGNERYAGVKAAIEKAQERLQEAVSHPRFQHRRLIGAFPNMKSLKYKDQLTKLKEYLENLKKGAKKKEKSIDN